jgi:hypothetical protein
VSLLYDFTTATLAGALVGLAADAVSGGVDVQAAKLIQPSNNIHFGLNIAFPCYQ